MLSQNKNELFMTDNDAATMKDFTFWLFKVELLYSLVRLIPPEGPAPPKGQKKRKKTTLSGGLFSSENELIFHDGSK